MSQAQSDVPLTLRAQFNGEYGYTVIGNTLNQFDNWQTPLPPCQLLTQSSAILNLFPNQTVVAAYLYWGGIGTGIFNPEINLNNIVYNATQTDVCYPENNLIFSYFTSFKNVTDQVISIGNNPYTLSNLNLNPIIINYCSSAVYNAAWHIIIVYKQIGLPNNQINIYNGNNAVSLYFNGGLTVIPINNLNVINNQNAKMTYVALNGSPNLFANESISINNNLLSNALNPANNPFNGTNSFTNSVNSWNQDIDTFDISPYINVGDTQFNIALTSFAIRNIQTVVTSIRSELPDATVQLTQVTGQQTCGNRNLVVNYSVVNTNSNAALPTNVPVSFYANNTLLQTVNTPSSIAIGASLPLQTTVSIPAAIPNNFTLKVIVNRNAANQSPIAESNLTNNEALQNITLLEATVSPTFALATTFCQAATMPVLPITSNNGILGSWSPNVINNQTSGSYVFTPNVGQCVSNFTLNVAITPSVLPSFVLQNTFCQNATVPVLPTTSSNGILGSWSPNVINNQTSQTYTFTPNVGQCAAVLPINITISPNVNPTFALQTTFCQNATVPVLPATSTNGFVGSWSPNVIDNQTSQTYTFTPNVGQCAAVLPINIAISPNVNPTFTLQTTFCQGATMPVLPTTSSNGFVGSWLPSVINNQTSQTYTFTPNVGQCALRFELNTTIQSQTPKTENLFICKDNQDNAISAVILDSKLNPSNFTFSWTLDNQLINQTTTSISVTTAGNYQLVASSNSLGCQQIFNFIVTAFAPITANFIVKEDFALSQTIVVEASGGSEPYSYSFDNLPFQSFNIFSMSDGGDILVKVKDKNNCYEVSKLITTWQYKPFFTPNGDGFNDSWCINTQKKIQVDIFDRFGKLVKQLNAGDCWNGTFKAQPLPATDYWFVIYYENNKVFKGHFALKR